MRRKRLWAFLLSSAMLLQPVTAWTAETDFAEDTLFELEATDILAEPETESLTKGASLSPDEMETVASSSDPSDDAFAELIEDEEVLSETTSDQLENEEHQWDVGYVTRRPTCVEEGIRVRPCMFCSETKTEPEPIIPENHNWGAWTLTKPSTCIEHGEETRTCTLDPSHAETREVLDIVHSWGLWEQKVAPTCTEAGIETRTCSLEASHTETKEVPALGHTWAAGELIEQATCGKDGSRHVICSVCGETSIQSILATNQHTYVQTGLTRATLEQDGSIYRKCSVCEKTVSEIIPRPSAIALSASSFTYNGKAQRPTVTVKDTAGHMIAPANYSVSYARGCSKVGRYKVTVSFKGSQYTGQKELYFTINPKATSLKKLTPGSKKLKVTWRKSTAQTSGYQLQYSTSSSFDKVKTVTIKRNTITSKKLTRLLKKKRYYVRLRTYKTVSGTKYYSTWSKTRTAVTKR